VSSGFDDRPTPDDRRWALLARELPFEQLGHARKQAENWRNALAAGTGVFGAVGLLRNRSDISALEEPWKIAVVAVLGGAFIALAAAFLVTVRAAYGRPGQTIYSDGESLRQFTADEAARVMRLLPLAAYLALSSVFLIVTGAAISWLAPAA
jgi:hypothetical protein